MIWTGDEKEIKFDGTISPEVAFQVGRFATMGIFLNDRANSAWVEYTPIEVGFTVHQEEETELFRVTIILNHSLRSVQYQLDGFTTHEDAVLYVDALAKFLKDNVI